jgi:hypothetical protein
MTDNYDPIFTEDAGFPIPFDSRFDFTVMTQVRMVITRPSRTLTFYDFALAEFNTVGVGDVLNYVVRPGDLTVKGVYEFQVFVKNATVDFGFEPYLLDVEARPSTSIWTLS